MGFLPPDSDSDTDTYTPTTDEESQLLASSSSLPKPSNGTPTKPLNFEAPFKRNVRISSAPLPHMPHHHERRGSSRSRSRYSGLAEVDEIWGELEEGGPSPLMSPFSLRRSSARSTPLGFRSSSVVVAGAAELPPDETTGLLARAGTGRSYRERRRRSVLAGVGGDGVGEGEGRRERAQGAVGGWWKMRWWRRRGREEESGDG